MTIEERLLKLERQVRFYRVVVLIITIVTLGGFLTGFQGQQEMEKDLKVRYLTADSVWAKNLYLENGKGDPEFSLGHDGFLLKNKSFNVTLAIFPKIGKVCLFLNGVENPSTVQICNTAEGEPSLEMVDKEGFSAILGVNETVTPATGEKHKTSAASLILFNKDKKIIRKIP